MINSAARLIGDVPDKRKKSGQSRGTIGTAFLVTIQSERFQEIRWSYVATAHHVLDDQTKVEVQPPVPFKDGELYDPLEVDDWRQPLERVDLAIAPLIRHRDERYSVVKLEEEILSPEHRMALQLGNKVHYIGILVPLSRPMVRSGYLGAIDQIGLATEGDYDYPAHLVDCRSYGGFSGSPVYLDFAYPVLDPLEEDDIPPHVSWYGEELPPLGTMYHVQVLCGMFTEHLDDRRRPDDRTVSRYGVGIMVRSEEIWEAFMTDEMKDERRKWDEQEARDRAADNGPALRKAKASENEEFERFEDALQEVIRVPKKVISERQEPDQ